ncbi:hypothetical protein ACFC1T_25720 [Kitasatospora sp. NPDC056076]|uniref:hypothetical protein n=1 Tax=Kitasatospora sp. NPDC056076 TaxID=3345703 RepID=UPI0035DA644A
MVGTVGTSGEPKRLLVVLGDGRRMVSRELSGRERAELGPPITGRLNTHNSAARSLVHWLRPALPVVVEVEASQVRRITLSSADN